MLTKQQAAERLDVSVRAIENYSTQGKLHPTYAAGKRGKVALFDESEVEALKESRGEVVYSPKPSTALALVTQQDERFTALLAAMRPPAVSVNEKILLTLKDCQALTSLSIEHLRAAIHAKKLNGEKIGAGFKVKRTDLDSYIENL